MKRLNSLAEVKVEIAYMTLFLIMLTAAAMESCNCPNCRARRN